MIYVIRNKSALLNLVIVKRMNVVSLYPSKRYFYGKVIGKGS